MLITIKSLKGGVGKSSLSYALANTLDTLYITNDKYNSVIPKIYPKSIQHIDKKTIAENTVIFDAGGFMDKNIKDTLILSDLIIVPLEIDINSVESTITLLKELKQMGKIENIIIIINKVKNKKTTLNDMEQISNFYQNNFDIPGSKIFKIGDYDIFKKIIDQKISIEDISRNKFKRYSYRNFFNDYNKIVDYIKRQK